MDWNSILQKRKKKERCFMENAFSYRSLCNGAKKVHQNNALPVQPYRWVNLLLRLTSVHRGIAKTGLQVEDSCPVVTLTSTYHPVGSRTINKSYWLLHNFSDFLLNTVIFSNLSRR